MKIPELHELEFKWMIENAIKETKNQIKQIVTHHGNGTYEEEQARSYVSFLENILKENNINN